MEFHKNARAWNHGIGGIDPVSSNKGDAYALVRQVSPGGDGSHGVHRGHSQESGGDGAGQADDEGRNPNGFGQATADNLFLCNTLMYLAT